MYVCMYVHFISITGPTTWINTSHNNTIMVPTIDSTNRCYYRFLKSSILQCYDAVSWCDRKGIQPVKVYFYREFTSGIGLSWSNLTWNKNGRLSKNRVCVCVCQCVLLECRQCACLLRRWHGLCRDECGNDNVGAVCGTYLYHSSSWCLARPIGRVLWNIPEKQRRRLDENGKSLFGAVMALLGVLAKRYSIAA